jgi:hypothetical protein
MSWQATAMAWSITDNLSAHERLMLLAMANYASEDGKRIFPGIERLGHDTGLSESTVKRCLATLVERGHLVLVQQGHGRGRASEYRMPIDFDLISSHQKRGQQKGSNEEIKGVKPENKGGQADPPTIQEDSIKKKPIMRATRLSADWTPSSDENRYAEDLGLIAQKTAEDFRDFWISKPGVMAMKLDWKATWRMWCRRAAERGQNAMKKNSDNLFGMGRL